MTDRLSQLPFLWGVAVSHSQVEGGDPCDWTAWEEAGRTRGGACGRAVGSWERYEDDARLAASLGANAFRFSVSWSRVEPEQGRWDAVALARYRRLVDTLAALGVEPVVTCFHYTYPGWFHEKIRGPRPGPSTPSRDSSAARPKLSAPRSGSTPFSTSRSSSSSGGFLGGELPPGISRASAARKALDNILAAHVAAAAAIREVVPGAAVGIAHNMMGFAPENPASRADRLRARVAGRSYDTGLLEAFATGRWRLFFPPFALLSGQRPELPGSLDFIGVNYYSRLHISLRSPDRVGLPLLVMENRLADGRDALRASFLRSHAAVLHHAIWEGLPIRGSLHWSLLDNFECLDGWEPRFGLVEVDRETLERRPRPSAAVFKELGAGFLSGGNPQA